jgi:hypothetical protein
MELDPPYCDVIIQRWEEFTGQKAQQLASDALLAEPAREENSTSPNAEGA